MKTQCRKINNLTLLMNLLKIECMIYFKENNVKNSVEILACGMTNYVRRNNKNMKTWHFHAIINATSCTTPI